MYDTNVVLRRHSLGAAIGLIALFVLSVPSVSPPSLPGFGAKTSADIGIEHALPLSLRMEVGVKANAGYVEFLAETDETIFLSVPSTWVRREVWNVPIYEVTSEAPSLGFTRWHLPPHAGISFHMPDAPASVILHNPSDVQMKLDLTYVDVNSETVKKETVLIQERTVKLW